MDDEPKKKPFNSRRKGKRNEMLVGKEVVDILNELVHPNPPFAYFQSKHFLWDMRKSDSSGGQFEPGDLIKSARLKAVFPFHLEVKAAETWSFESLAKGTWLPLMKFWKQSTEDCPAGETPIVVMRRKGHKDTYVLFRFRNAANVLRFGQTYTVFKPRSGIGAGGVFIVMRIKEFMRGVYNGKAGS